MRALSSLFKLTLDRNRKDRDTQVHRFTHQRESASGDDASRRAQIFEKTRTRKGKERNVSHTTFSCRSVDAKFNRKFSKYRQKILFSNSALVDDDMLPWFAHSIEDLGTQDRPGSV